MTPPVPAAQQSLGCWQGEARGLGLEVWGLVKCLFSLSTQEVGRVLMVWFREVLIGEEAVSCSVEGDGDLWG